MKRIIIVLAVVTLIVGGMTFTDYPLEQIDYSMGVQDAWAGDTAQNYSIAIGDVILDSVYSVEWEVIDSIITTVVSPGITSFTISGWARLDPGDVFWLGFTNIKGSKLVDSLVNADSRNMDSIRIEGPNRRSRFSVDMPFSFTTVDTLLAAVDTIFVVGAVEGTADIRKVELRRVVLEIHVGGYTYP